MSRNIWDGDKRSQFRRLRRRDDEEEPELKENLTPAEEYKEYIKTVFARSYIATFADVAETPSNKKKFIKLFVFFFSVFGLFYQVTDFTTYYLGYPTLRNEFLLRPFYMELPAITICNANRYRRRIYCRDTTKVKIVDYNNETEFCQKYSRFCPDKGIPYTKICEPYDGSFIRHDKEYWKEVKRMGHNTSMIASCTEKSDYDQQSCALPYKPVPIISNLNQYFAATYCYTINSDVGKPNAKSRNVGRNSVINIEIHTQLDEYYDYDETPSIYVSVHDRNRIVNPFTGGKRLYAGIKYTGYVMDMTTTKLMPPPYDTNCTDYLKMWKENGGNGPLTNQECREYCAIKFLVQRGQCIPFDITVSHDESLCESHEARTPDDIDRVCSKNCVRPCFSRTYKMDYEENGRIWCDPKKYFGVSDWCRQSNLNLTISFLKFWYVKVSSDPRIQDIEFFSNVGGYLGMWIGISLVDGIDFLGCLYLIVLFPRLRKKLKERKKIQDISEALKQIEDNKDKKKDNELQIQVISNGQDRRISFHNHVANVD